MSDIKRNLQESVVLHNTFISILPKMLKNNDKQFFKFVRERSRENVSLASDFICKEVDINLLKEVFTLINQVWANDSTRFNEGLSNEKAILKVIKSQISQDGKSIPFNNKELYKRIRQSIVHNNKANPNFIYNLSNFKLNLGKVNDEDYIITLTPYQVVQLVYVLFNNTSENKIYASVSIKNVDSIASRAGIKNNIKILNDDNEIDLDNNQIERVYNYFKYVKNNMNIIGNENEIKKALYFPHNAESLFVEKLKALMIVGNFNSGTTWKDITTQYPDMLENKDFLNFYFCLISNLLFTIASNQTNNELEEMLCDCIDGITSEDVRHIRNSLCHGRYFHDFNKTFYFYDGKKKLDFKFKLTIDNINTLLDKISKGKYSVVLLK